MRSDPLLDPELRALVEGFPAMSWSAELLPQIRAMLDQMAAAMPLPDLPVYVESRAAPRLGEAGDVPVILHRPRGDARPKPALLDIHGGGFVAGAARHAAARHSRLAHDLDCVIVSVDYRLAPEAPYPAALDDCFSALFWLYDQAETLGVDPARIAVGGDSAGGGLAAALAIMARDAGLMLAAQILTYPMLDDRTGSTVAAGPLAGEYLWDAASNRFAWQCYLGRAPGGKAQGYAAAARIEDLSGLPPAFIAVGQLDLFVEEDVDYARRLLRAGVATELHLYPGAVHGFDLVADARCAIAYEQARLGALRRAFRL